MSRCSPVQLAFDLHEAEDVDRERTPVIFLHGLTASKENWFDLPKVTADHTKRVVYAIDARNHGDTEWTEGFDLESNVDDLLHFMDQRGMSRAILVGHSMGAITSFKTAIRAPERIEKVFAEDMSVKKVPQDMYDRIIDFLDTQKKAFEALPLGLSESEAKAFVVKHIFDNVPDDVKIVLRESDSQAHEELLCVRETGDGRYAPKANVEAIVEMAKESSAAMDEYEGSYEGPVRVVYGKLSPFLVGEDEAIIQRHMPHAELVCVESATHTVHTDCPDEFRERLLEFLS